MIYLTKKHGALFKAKSKVGLVAIKKTVKGKKKTFTRTYWMKPEDAEKLKKKEDIGLSDDKLKWINGLMEYAKYSGFRSEDLDRIESTFTKQEKKIFVKMLLDKGMFGALHTARKFHLIHSSGFVFENKEDFQKANKKGNGITISDYLNPSKSNFFNKEIKELIFIPEDKIFDYFSVDNNSEKAAEIEKILSKANFKKKSLDDKVLNTASDVNFSKKLFDMVIQDLKSTREDAENKFNDSGRGFDEYTKYEYFGLIGSTSASVFQQQLDVDVFDWFEHNMFQDLGKKWTKKDYDLISDKINKMILPKTTPQEVSIKDLFEQTFDKKEHASIEGNYTVHAVYEFKNKNFDAKEAEEKDHKSKQLQFHGTKGKYIQSFIDNGVIVPNEADVGRMLGDGFYTTPVSSKAMQYMDEDGFSRKSGLGVIFISEQYLGEVSVDKLGYGDHDTCSLKKGEYGLKNPENATTFVEGVKITHACIVSLGGNKEQLGIMLNSVRDTSVITQAKGYYALKEREKKVIKSLYEEMWKNNMFSDVMTKFFTGMTEKQQLEAFFTNVIKKGKI